MIVGDDQAALALGLSLKDFRILKYNKKRDRLQLPRVQVGRVTLYDADAVAALVANGVQP
jgi:hypothetical protein